jgi:hypothetical protein
MQLKRLVLAMLTFLALLVFDFHKANFWPRMQDERVVLKSSEVAYELFDIAVIRERELIRETKPIR